MPFNHSINWPINSSINNSINLEAGAFSPLDLSPALWLDASDTSTITAATTDYITGDSSNFEGGTVGSWSAAGVSNVASTDSPLAGSYSNIVTNTGGGGARRTELTVSGLVVGETYTFSCKSVLLSGTNYRFAAWTISADPNITKTNTTVEDVEFDVVATATTGLIRIYAGLDTGHSFKIDDVKLQRKIYVSQWDDKSGNGNHAVQGTGSLQLTTGAATMNSLNILTFNGTVQNEMTFSNISSAEMTMFFVFRRVSGNEIVLGGNSGGQGDNYLMSATNRGEFRIGGSDWKNTPVISDTDVVLVIRGSDTTGDFDYAFGTDALTTIAENPSFPIGTATINTIGSSFFDSVSTGGFAEIIVVPSLVSESDIASTQALLVNKWTP